MKKLFTIAALSIGFAVAASAQDTKAPAQPATTKKEAKADLKKELNLTPDQQTQWKNLNKEYKPKMMAVRNDKSLTDEQRKQQLKALNKEKQGKLNAILTPDQQSKLADLKKQRVAIFKAHVKELNLTQDQKTQWQSINKEYKAKMMAVRNDKSLNDMQRKQQIKGLAREKKDKVNAILNDDQKAKLAEFRKERRQQFKHFRTEVWDKSNTTTNS